jgi:pimeloyl-ACP methyl ester carboxylesterase
VSDHRGVRSRRCRHTARLSQEIAAAITGSKLIVIEQCGHLITMEKPEETNAILRKWLS